LKNKDYFIPSRFMNGGCHAKW